MLLLLSHKKIDISTCFEPQYRKNFIKNIAMGRRKECAIQVKCVAQVGEGVGKKVCAVDDCSDKVHASGLCNTHGGKLCSIKGCSTKAHAGGLCGKHGGDRKHVKPDCTRQATRTPPPLPSSDNMHAMDLALGGTGAGAGTGTGACSSHINHSSLLGCPIAGCLSFALNAVENL